MATTRSNQNVNKPKHYRSKSGKFDVLDILKEYGIYDTNFPLGNTIKYILRAGKKDKNKYVEDLEKARFYLDDYINYVKNAANKRK